MTLNGWIHFYLFTANMSHTRFWALLPLQLEFPMSSTGFMRVHFVLINFQYFCQAQLQVSFHFTRWALTSYNYKWSFNPYTWPYEWLTGVLTLLLGVITPLSRSQSCRTSSKTRRCGLRFVVPVELWSEVPRVIRVDSGQVTKWVTLEDMS